MTTPEEHNKYLAYSHLAYAGFQLLMMALMGIFFYVVFASMPPTGREAGFPAGFFALMMGIMFLFQMLFAVPSLFAGFGLLKHKSWAKTASIIAGVLSAMSFPIGTAVCVYTFWFLFSEPGKALYDRKPAATASRADYFLREPANEESVGNWGTRRREEYAPPGEMPNWRE